MEVLVAWLCPTVGDPVDYSPPDSSVYGILQARILAWVAISFSRGSSSPGLEPTSPDCPAFAGRFFATEPPRAQKTFGRHYVKQTKASLLHCFWKQLIT